MATEEAIFTTNWVAQDQDGEIINTPGLPIAHPVDKWVDVTGQPTGNIIPDPNQYNIKVTADDTVIDAIVADPQFVLLEGTRAPVGTQTFLADSIPTQQEFDTWRTQYQFPEDIFGNPLWTSQQLIDAVGTTVDSRTWTQINTGLNDYLVALDQGAGVFTVNPVQLNDGSIGVLTVGGQGSIDPPDIAAVPVIEIATNTAAGGIFAFVLQSPLNLDGVLRGIQVINGPILSTADALYTSNPNRWVWFNTNYSFTANQPARILIAVNQ